MTNLSEKVIVGVENLVYSVVGADGTYGTVKDLADIVNLTITPSVNTNTLYASNKAVAAVSSQGATEIEVEVAALPREAVEEILGVQRNSEGVLVYGKDNAAPYIALGFKGKTAKNGVYRHVWVTKMVFSQPSESYATQTDQTEFQNQSISGTAINDADGVWKYEIDSDSAVTGANTVIANWFASVYQPA